MQIKHDLEKQSNTLSLEIAEAHNDLLIEFPEIATHLATKLSEWRVESSFCLKKDYPFTEDNLIFNQWKSNTHPSPSNGKLKKGINHYQKFRINAKLPDESEYWKSEFEKVEKHNTPKSAEKNLIATIKLLSNNWQKDLDKTQLQWEIDELNKYREIFFQHFASFLAWIKKLKQVLENLGLNAGLLLDFSNGNLKESDIEQFKRWSNYLSKQKSVLALCELLGRLRQIEVSERLETVCITQEIQRSITDPHLREEITGIKFGQDIANALPIELALLNEPDTSLLFDLKYIESRLMCFDMSGIQSINEQIDVEAQQSICEKDKLGPMIICVDTSGSMQGSPENIAKAATLYLSSKAREMRRDCYLINFSTGISTIDLSASMGMKDLIAFLKMSFHGGTDAAPALMHAIEQLKTNKYENADVLVISDFIMADLPDTLHQAVEEKKLQGNKFYSLIIGQCFMHTRLQGIFDQEWVFDPTSSSIEEINQFSRSIEI